MEIAYKRPNWFVRILITLFCVFLTSMILYRFLWVMPRAELSAGMIVLLCLLLVLVLAESFDNFSVGKLISISREAKSKGEEVEKLTAKNERLISQLISVSNSQSQNQTHYTVSGNLYASPTVAPASEEEVSDKQSSETQEQPAAAGPARQPIDRRKLEELILNKYMQQRAIDQSNLIREAKFVNEFREIDPISNSQVIFDGYLKGKDHETFIETKISGNMGLFLKDRLYVMLSKVNYYRVSKRIDAHLDLVLANIPNETRRANNPDRWLENFAPAIASGLLKISTIELTEQEANSCREG